MVLEANDNFLSTTGYKRDEVIGKHHRLFCSETLYKSDEYRQFWERLNQGEFFSGQFPRLNRRGELYGCGQPITLCLTATGSSIRL